MSESYSTAQYGMSLLKTAVHSLLANAGHEGLSNAQIGRSLGIYAGHVGHEGHISRTILAIMESEGVVVQDPNTKVWKIRLHRELDSER